MPDTDVAQNDFDGPWKEALAHCFAEALELLAPELHARIDWDREVVFLDTELQRLIPDAGDGRRHVDRLARVHRRSGGETLVLVHVEVQADPDPSFPERMFRYSYRAFDAFHLPVESVAILADGNPGWRPDHYEQQALCSLLRLDFTAIKLLDWEDRWAELERSKSPFAVFVMAHLKARRTRAGEERLYWKTTLVRSLYQKGLSHEQVNLAFHLVDWVMSLPRELTIRFRDEVILMEANSDVKHVSSIQQLGREEGREEARREAISAVLRARFGSVPEEIAKRIDAVAGAEALRALTTAAAVSPDLDAFVRALAQTTEQPPSSPASGRPK